MADQEAHSRDVRSFIAVLVPPNLRAGTASVQSRLRGAPGVKWVEPENFHFTLRFLGNVAPGRLQVMQAGLAAALAEEKAFDITLAGVGAFPSVRRPQTIWVGVTAGASTLEALAAAVEKAAVAQGFPPERRPFRAHLTLGRVKAERPPAELVRTLEAEPAGEVVGSMQVAEVSLMRSELYRAGPTYTRLAAFALEERGEGVNG